MKAVVWHGPRDVRVDTVPDPTIQEPTDAIVRMTTTGLCGSDLHLYEVLGPYMREGDIIGHEPMGIVEAVGDDVTNLAVGDRVVIPFQIACGRCDQCNRGLQTQCETTQVTEEDSGAALALHALRELRNVTSFAHGSDRDRETEHWNVRVGPELLGPSQQAQLGAVIVRLHLAQTRSATTTFSF